MESSSDSWAAVFSVTCSTLDVKSTLSSICKKYRAPNRCEYLVLACLIQLQLTNFGLLDGIISKYNLMDWLGGFVAGLVLPSLHNQPYFQHLVDKMEAVGEEQQNLPVVPKIFSSAARLGFVAGLFMLAPAAIPSIAVSLPVPSLVSASNELRLDLPSLALKVAQFYVAAHQGVFSAVRLHRLMSPPRQHKSEENAVVPCMFSSVLLPHGNF